MFVKQIDMAKALELAAKGMEIKVLAPIGQEDGWENLVPDTLQNIFYGIVLRVLARFDGKPFMPHILKGSHLPPDLLLSQLLSGNMAVLLMIRAVDTSVDAIIGQI